MKHAMRGLLQRPVIVAPTTSWTLQYLRSGMDLLKHYDAYIVDLTQLAALATRVESTRT